MISSELDKTDAVYTIFGITKLFKIRIFPLMSFFFFSRYLVIS